MKNINAKTVKYNNNETVAVGCEVGKKEALRNGFDCGNKKAYAVCVKGFIGYGYDFNDALLSAFEKIATLKSKLKIDCNNKADEILG